MRPRHTLYRQYSQAVWTAIGEIVPRVERTGIDEGYLDLGSVLESFSGARRIAEAVQVAVRGATSLSCSLGVSTAKVVCKVASDRRKPGGITVVPPGPRGALPRAACRRASCPVSGRAPRSGSRRRGSRRSASSPRSPTRRCGPCSPARSAGSYATGRAGSIRAISSSTPSGSRSRPRRRSSATSTDRAALHAELRRMAAEVAAYLRRDGLSARTVTTKLRYADFSLRLALDDARDADRRARADRRPRVPAARPRAPRPAGRAAARRRRRLRAHGAIRQLTLDELSLTASTRGAKQRARQARRPAVALARDLVAVVRDDVDAGALHPAARLVVALEGERAPRPEREHVRPLRLELLVGHLDDLDPALGEEPHEPASERCAGYTSARSRSSGEMNDMRCMTSPAPFQCGRSNAITSTPGNACRSASSDCRVRAVADPDEQRVARRARRCRRPRPWPGARCARRPGTPACLERRHGGLRLAAPPSLPGQKQHRSLAPRRASGRTCRSRRGSRDRAPRRRPRRLRPRGARTTPRARPAPRRCPARRASRAPPTFAASSGSGRRTSTRCSSPHIDALPKPLTAAEASRRRSPVGGRRARPRAARRRTASPSRRACPASRCRGAA